MAHFCFFWICGLASSVHILSGPRCPSTPTTLQNQIGIHTTCLRKIGVAIIWWWKATPPPPFIWVMVHRRSNVLRGAAREKQIVYLLVCRFQPGREEQQHLVAILQFLLPTLMMTPVLTLQKMRRMMTPRQWWINLLPSLLAALKVSSFPLMFAGFSFYYILKLGSIMFCVFWAVHSLLLG